MKYSVLFAALLAAAQANALTIDNSALMTGRVYEFGSVNTATYGEYFRTNASDTYLNSFSLFLSDRYYGSGELKLKGYLGTWDGSKLGQVLYSSAEQTMNAAGNLQEFSFAPGVQLLANTSYIAFLSVSELGSQDYNTFSMPAGNDDDATTGFVFMNNGRDFDALARSSWNVWSSSDVRFVANLSDGAPVPGNNVPEPMSLALLGIGLLGLTAARKVKSVG